MPWTDWQFWVVTLLTLACCYPLYRTLRPQRRGCRTRTTLTVSARQSSAESDA